MYSPSSTTRAVTAVGEWDVRLSVVSSSEYSDAASIGIDKNAFLNILKIRVRVRVINLNNYKFYVTTKAFADIFATEFS
jgi:hypothetical protein